MKEVELKILDMSSVLKPSDSFALVLEEVGGEERKLALIIGAIEAQGIKMAEMHYRPPRPFTHDLLLNVMAVGRLQCLKGVIYQVKNGIYSTYLYIRRADGEVDVVDARTSDAIVFPALCIRRYFGKRTFAQYFFGRFQLYDVNQLGRY